MFQNLLLQHYLSRYNKIKNNYLIAVKDSDPEGFHDMRVEIKQMRAFFNLIEYLNPEFNSKKNFKVFRRLFKAAGIVRDVHVQQDQTKEFEKKLNREFPGYNSFLKQRETDTIMQFSEFSSKFDIDSLAKRKKMIAKATNDIPINSAESKAANRFNDLIDKLFELKNNEDSGEEKYHQIRILLKETRYTLEILLECFPDLDLRIELNEELRGLHRILGKWHDDDIGIEFLQMFKTADKNEQVIDTNTFNEVLNKLKEEKKYLLTQFENKWNDFVVLLNQEIIY